MNPVQSRQPTPTPWIADPDWREGFSWNIHICGANPDMRVCFMTSDGPAQANADLIVEAVNNYDRLTKRVEELEAALRELFDQPTENPLRMTVEQRERLWAAHAKARAALQRTEP